MTYKVSSGTLSLYLLPDALSCRLIDVLDVHSVRLPLRYYRYTGALYMVLTVLFTGVPTLGHCIDTVPCHR